MDRNDLILALSLLGLKEDASSIVSNNNGYISFVGGSYTIDINNYQSTTANIFIPYHMDKTGDGTYLSKDDGDSDFSFEQVLTYATLMVGK